MAFLKRPPRPAEGDYRSYFEVAFEGFINFLLWVKEWLMELLIGIGIACLVLVLIGAISLDIASHANRENYFCQEVGIQSPEGFEIKVICWVVQDADHPALIPE